MSSVYTQNFSYNYYLRNAYSKNINATKSDYRTNRSKKELISADSGAVRKIAEKLRDMDYDTDHSTDIIQNTKVFIESYNNLLDSTKDTGNASVTALKKRLTGMTSEEKEELASIGIEIKSNGKLKLDEKTFGECKPSKVKKVLSSDNTFTDSIKTYAGRIYRASSQMQASYGPNAQKKKTAAATNASLLNISL